MKIYSSCKIYKYSLFLYRCYIWLFTKQLDTKYIYFPHSALLYTQIAIHSDGKLTSYTLARKQKCAFLHTCHCKSTNEQTNVSSTDYNSFAAISFAAGVLGFPSSPYPYCQDCQVEDNYGHQSLHMESHGEVPTVSFIAISLRPLERMQ